MTDLLGQLKHTFGYDTFRPLQREIIESSLAGKDVFALLPTGGGKSLCFQLPALLRNGLTVVVSPLIALMKDQVDQLQAAGVAATFLNSSLTATESRERLRGLHQGEWKLLYVAPERLMLDNWKENLTNWNISALAIDEAHCISEWGHDFRPEYRQISRLRELLPDIPVTALTATATERVKLDIIKHLNLRDPEIFVASFNRPNLQYRVKAKDQPLKQILDFVKTRPEESGIVYCASRAACERLAESLSARGYRAAAYHAGLSNTDRASNQELFLRDEIRIICATIAFGMGINKPNVRWVIHYDLPKNIEGYYQETGRAGRDGLPADCILLFSPGDVAKQIHFLDEITDQNEKQTAHEQLRKMVHYAESPVCRRKELLVYFGEDYPGESCDSCDNCLEPREVYDATVPAQKLLSCICRIRQATGFATGLNHVIAVLMGGTNEKIERWGHHQLSTYGIGKDLSRPEWAAIGRDLLRLGLLQQSSGQYPTMDITPEGVEALKSRRILMLTKPVAMTKSRAAKTRTGSISCDEVLLSRLKTRRKQIADELQVPPYIVFGDATLREMARHYPETAAQMLAMPGVGDKKLAQFGDSFAAVIREHLSVYPRVAFGRD